MSGGYTQFRYWSPMYGDWVTRLSMADERGVEHFVELVPGRSAALRREQRKAALEALADAVLANSGGGEVRL